MIAMKFEWDEQKNNSNIQKHGIDFIDACEIFNGYVYIDYDNREDYDEDRWLGIGMLPNGLIITVVFTERGEDTVRFISARRANYHERKYYQETIPY